MVLVLLALPLMVVTVVALVPGPALRLGLWVAGVDATFDDLHLDLDDLELRGLRLEKAADHRLDRLQIHYRARWLLAGRIDAVEVEGLLVRARLDDGTLRLPGLETTDEDGDGEFALPWPERLTVAGSRLELATAWGDATIPIAGELRPRADRAAFVLEVDDGVLAAQSGHLAVSLRFEGETSLDPDTMLERVEGVGHGELSAAGLTVPGLGRLDGGATLRATLRPGQIEANLERTALTIDVPAAEWTELAALLPPPWRIELPRPLTVVASQDEDGMRFDGDVGVAVIADGPEVDLATRAAVSIQSGRAAQLTLRQGRLELRDVDARGMRLERGAATFAGGGTLDAFEAMVDLELTGGGEPSPGVHLDAFALQHRLDVRVDQGMVEFRGQDVGTATARVRWRETAGDVSARLEPGGAPLLRARLLDDGIDWQALLMASVPEAAVTVERVAEPLRADLAADRLLLELGGRAGGIEHGHVTIDGGSLILPQHAIALDEIATEVRLDAAGVAHGRPIPLTVGLLVHRGQPTWFRPLRVEATLRLEGERLPFEVLLARPGGAAELRLSGTHHRVTGDGEARVELPTVTFAADRIQPTHLAPVLGDYLEQVSGRVAAQGTVAWRADGASRADLDLLIENLAFAAGPTRLERVNGIVTFNRVLPLATAPGQQLAVGLLDFGLPLTDGIVTFRLEPDPAVAIEALTWRFAGGTVRADPFRFGSDDRGLTTTLEAEGLDLDQLLALTELAGLTGEGSIGGTLPVTVRGGEASIEGGELVADGPGWLRYRPEAAPAALEAGGENVGLLLEALENFRYEALRITLDGRTDTAMDVRLHLAGANPDLYDGYPIEFNLNLEGELGNLLRSGLASYQIPERIHERMQGFSR